MDTIYNVIQSIVGGIAYTRAKSPIFERTAAQAVAASTAGVHAAVADTGVAQTGIGSNTNPPCARSITATITGTNTDVKAVSVVVRGKRNGVAVTATLPAFTVDTLGTVESVVAMDEVTDWDSPAHDGTGVSVSLGWGDKLGLDFLLSRNTFDFAFLANAREGTAPTVVVSATNLESNHIKLNSALNGTAVAAYFRTP